MMSHFPLNQVSICLMAAFQPTPSRDEIRSSSRTSASLKDAIARMDHEASTLKETVVSGRRPFRDTLLEIVEHLTT